MQNERLNLGVLRCTSRFTVVGAALMLLALTGSAWAMKAQPPRCEHWVRAWGAALMAPEDFEYYKGIGRTFRDVTLRQVVSVSLPTRSLRVWISNEYGSKRLVIGDAYIAPAVGGSRIDETGNRKLTFGGQPSIWVPAGGAVVSDTVPMAVPAGSLLAVSLYLPDSTQGSTSTVHAEGWRMGYQSVPGDYSAVASLPIESKLPNYFYIAGVDVRAPRRVAAIVALGDSITDGDGSTPDAGKSWPDDLAQRLARAMPGERSVIDMGISGNRLLHESYGPSALARVNRDVFAVPGIRYLIVLEGINDLSGPGSSKEQPVSAEDVIAALSQLANQAHIHGLSVIGGTLTPDFGCADCGGMKAEEDREKVDAWIRESGVFDSVVDFDLAVRDPADPRRVRAAYDSGDHLHMNDAGYEAMAQAFDLAIFKSSSVLCSADRANTRQRRDGPEH